MSAVLLGLRLARAGGRLRAGLVALGTAVGTFVLLVGAALPAAIQAPGTVDSSGDQRRFAAVVVTAVAVPVVVLLMTVTRLSAATRDRRLSALRLLGVPRARTLLAAATEAGTHALAGSVVGTTAYALAQPALTAADRAWRGWLRHGLHATPGQLVAVALGVPMFAVLVSLAPAAARPTRVGHARPLPRRPSLARLAPVAVGVVLLGVALARQGPQRSAADLLLFIAGTALAGVGVPLAVPVGVRLLADLLVRAGRTPGLLLAGRRLQLEPASTTRVVAALLAAAYVVVGARCVLAAFEQTPQYVRAEAAATTGPQRIDVDGQGRSRTRPVSDAEVRTLLAGLREVRSVAAQYPPLVQVGAAADRALVASTGTCADLAAQLGVEGCRDDRPIWLVRQGNPVTPGDQPSGPATFRAEDAAGQKTVTVDLPLPVRTYATDPDDPNLQTAFTDGPFVPLGVPGAAAAAGPADHWVVLAAGGRATVERVRAALAPLGVSVAGESEEDGDLRTVAGYRATLWAVAALLFGVGLLGLGIAGIDRAVARRREVAALASLGVPLRLLRRIQLLQAALPLTLGLPAAGLAGLLAGAAYLHLAEDPHVPVPSALAAVAAAALLGVAAALGTTLAVSAEVTPDGLRGE